MSRYNSKENMRPHYHNENVSVPNKRNYASKHSKASRAFRTSEKYGNHNHNSNNPADNDVESRYEYWKSFWSNIQNLKDKFEPEDGVSMPTSQRKKHVGPVTSRYHRKESESRYYTNEKVRESAARRASNRRSSMDCGVYNDKIPRASKPMKPTSSSKDKPIYPTKPAVEQPQTTKTNNQNNQNNQNNDNDYVVPEMPSHIKPGSNVAKFWAEEQARQGKVRQFKGKTKRKPSFTTPNNQFEAKKMWEKMKEQVDEQWKEYSSTLSKEEQDALNGTFEAMTPKKQKKKPVPIFEPSLNSTPETPKESSYENNNARSNVYDTAVNVPKSEKIEIPSPVQQQQQKKDPNDLTTYTVRELKDLLARYRIPVAGCLDKDDLISRFKTIMEARKDRVKSDKQKKEAVELAKKKETEEAETKERIVKEVLEWAKGKSIHNMLNDVNKFKSPTKQLKKSQSFTPVNKAYRKALLKIHPDKHMSSGFADHIRATEMFKVINTKFSQFKEESEKAKKRPSRTTPSYPHYSSSNGSGRTAKRTYKW